MTNPAEFAALIPQMSPRDQNFASSLLSAMQSSRGLSDKQAYWVNTLAQRVTNPKAPETGITLEPLAVMMRRAKNAGLQHPKVSLAYEGMTFTLSLAGAASANAGHIYVKIDGDYAGKVSPQGEFRGKDLAVPGLRHFAADPAKAATEYGRLTGCCSFCRQPLRDERSTAVGYGPVCAKKFGMPWG